MIIHLWICQIQCLSSTSFKIKNPQTKDLYSDQAGHKQLCHFHVWSKTRVGLVSVCGVCVCVCVCVSERERFSVCQMEALSFIGSVKGQLIVLLCGQAQ